MRDDVNVSAPGGENSDLLYTMDTNSTFNPDHLNSGAWLPASITIVRGACLVVISILGASFNTFMILAIVPNRRLRTVRNILLVHLGGVGLMSSVFTTMYPAIITFHGKWIGGKPMCQTYAYITCVFTSVSVWTIAALSWDKYQTIASPLHHSLTATIRKMLPCFSVFWACGLILSLPPLFGANEFSFHSSMGICGVNSSSTAGRWYTCVLVCLSFIFPFCLMIYCYAHIFRIARTQSSRIAATMLRMVSVIQAPIAPATQSSLSLRGTKAMGTILQLIGSFVLTYLPYAVIILYEVIFAVHANAVFVSIATTLFLAAPFTHAAIYGIRNQILRTSFHRFTRRKIQHCCAKDKRRGSVKSLPRKSSTTFKLPMKCIVRSDGKKYILRRTLSCQGRPSNGQTEPLVDNMAVLPRPHSFNVLRDPNGCSPPLSNGTSSRRDRDDNRQIKEVSFSEKDEVSYIRPDGVSYAVREEVSYYSKDMMKEMSVMDWEMEEMSRFDREDEEMLRSGKLMDDTSSSDTLKNRSSSGQHRNGSTIVDGKELSTSDTLKDEILKLHKFKEELNKLDRTRLHPKTNFLKDKTKSGHKERSKKGRQRVDLEESSIFDREESSVFQVGDDEESQFEMNSDDGISHA